MSSEKKYPSYRDRWDRSYRCQLGPLCSWHMVVRHSADPYQSSRRVGHSGVRRPKRCCRLRRCGPLIRIKSDGMKKIRRRCGISPFPVLKRRHIEMQEHAETQIHKPLL